MSSDIKTVFGGDRAEEYDAIYHIIEQRGYEFFETHGKTTLAVHVVDDLHELGYEIIRKGES